MTHTHTHTHTKEKKHENMLGRKEQSSSIRIKNTTRREKSEGAGKRRKSK